jgi:hypothetical protein
VEVATPDSRAGELAGVQAVEAMAEVEPRALRRARRRRSDGRLERLDEPRAEAEAASREVDALWDAALAPVDAGLRRGDPPVLADAGGDAGAVDRLAERGLMWRGRTDAGDLALAHIHERAPLLLDPRTPARVEEWIDAVADGTLGRRSAVERARALLREALPPAGLGTAPRDLPSARVLGDCPSCRGPMRPLAQRGRRRLVCDECEASHPLPARGALRGVPGGACPACGAPLVRVEGARARCVDRLGCPSAPAASVHA